MQISVTAVALHDFHNRNQFRQPPAFQGILPAGNLKGHAGLIKHLCNHSDLLMGPDQHGKIHITAGGSQIGVIYLAGIDGMEAGPAHQLCNDPDNGLSLSLCAGKLKNANGFDTIFFRICPGIGGMQPVVPDHLIRCI